jgi:hypothetical protein
MAPPWELPMVEAQRKAAQAGDPIPGGIPARVGDPVTGRQFIDDLKKLGPAERQAHILKLLDDGQVPDFLRDLYKVELVDVPDADGNLHKVQYSVMPDFVAIGTNDDYVLVPMNSEMAQHVLLSWDMAPPTAQMVDQIATRGPEVQFRADTGTKAFRPYDSAEGLEKYYQRNEQVTGRDYYDAWLDWTGTGPDSSVVKHSELGGHPAVGHMKEFVMMPAETLKGASDLDPAKGDTNPDTIGMYHRTIQNDNGPGKGVPLDHNEQYFDYSQGLRAVSPIVYVDGTPMHISDVLKHDKLHTVLSGDGKMQNPALHHEGSKK